MSNVTAVEWYSDDAGAVVVFDRQLTQAEKATFEQQIKHADETSERWETGLRNVVTALGWARRDFEIPDVAKEVERLRAALLDCSSYVPADSIMGRELRELLPDANWSAVETCEPRSQAATDVLAERLRQVTAEGWTPDRDDTYTFGELAEAASAYLRHVSLHWPNGWDKAWYKPTTRRRDLVKSAALILAEIERLDRHSVKASEPQTHPDAGGFCKL